MKVLKNVVEVQGEGLEALLGEKVTLFCGVYIYTGNLVGVNEKCAKLTDAGIVYETGAFSDKAWKDCQKLPNDWYVSTAAIESFGVLK
jgi:hypothetical protein